MHITQKIGIKNLKTAKRGKHTLIKRFCILSLVAISLTTSSMIFGTNKQGASAPCTYTGKTHKDTNNNKNHTCTTIQTVAYGAASTFAVACIGCYLWDHSNWNSLHWAAAHGDLGPFQKLNLDDNNDRQALESFDARHRTPLYIAIVCGNHKIIDCIVEKIANINPHTNASAWAKSLYEEQSRYGLLYTWYSAVYHNDVKALEYLIALKDSKHYLNWFLGTFGTPLDEALIHGSFKAARFLIGKQAECYNIFYVKNYCNENSKLLSILKFLREQNYIFNFSKSLDTNENPAKNALLIAIDLKSERISNFYINKCNILRCINDKEREEIIKQLEVCIKVIDFKISLCDPYSNNSILEKDKAYYTSLKNTLTEKPVESDNNHPA